MSEGFDAYHRWLGIRPKDQPANHYRLLGIDLFESDPEVIRDAAERQMAHVRTYQLGPQSAASQKILNELAAAKACLLDRAKKADYDVKLRQKIAQPHAAERQSAFADDAAQVDLGFDVSSIVRHPYSPKRRPRFWKFAIVLAAATMVLLAVVAVIMTGRNKDHGDQSPAPLQVASQSNAEKQSVTRGESRPPINPSKREENGPVESEPVSVETRLPSAAQPRQEAKPTDSPPSLPVQAGPTTTPPANEDKPPPAPVAERSEKVANSAFTNSIGMQFALIPAGEFWMGSSEEHIKWAIEYANSHYIRPNQIAERIAREGPPRRVFVRIPFYLGVFEVTQSEFQQIMGPNSIARPAQQQPPAGDYARLPVGNVSWNEAVEFCRRLSRSPRERAARCQYRLPTEAEWEYACFAGATVSEPNRLKGIYNVTGTTWYASNSGKNPHCVGEKQPNKWGLYDMLGNVAEWCFNQYDVNYFAQSPPTSKKSPNAPRAVRGGSFADGSLSSRPSYRSQAAPDSRKPEIGFRVVLVR